VTGDTHYDLEVLAELAEGLLDDTTAWQVRQHLAVCDPCGESLADLAAVREVLAAVPTPAMPLGVAMRIDRALAAEAPDWDRIMRDAPWEVPGDGLVESDGLLESEPVVAGDGLFEDDRRPAPEPALSAPSAPQPVAARLGVVAEDGTVVPVIPAQRKKTESTPAKRRHASRRRLWALPAAAAAAAAVIIGGTGVVTNMLSSGDSSGQFALGQGETTPPRTEERALASSYSIFASGHNYTSRELRGPLLGYFGVAPGSGTNEDEGLDTCVKRFSNRLDRKPIGVDKALYNGNDATIMAFWEDKNINAVRVVVVDSACHSLRPDGLATWK
jgi:hypothetical protein